MKQYIKPTTTVENVVLDIPCALTVSGDKESIPYGDGTDGAGVTSSDAKNRDVWSEGYW